MRYSVALLLAVGLAGRPVPLGAQDTLRLGELHEAALRRDPRARQLELLARASALRLRDIDVERLPQLSATAEATHQSDVTTVQLGVPGVQPPQPPKDRWQAVLGVQQLLYDAGSRSARRAVERARLAESEAGVRTELYRLREEVDAAFFTAYLLQARASEVVALATDLTARREILSARVREGAALAGEVATVEAELERANQSVDELRASRRAALAVLARLTGRAVTDRDSLVLPDLRAPVAAATAADSAAGAAGGDALRERPEFDRFARTRERLAREADALAAERRPRVVAFGQAGYGRPGLDQFSTEPDEFWLAGVRLEWAPWSWGTTRRRQEALRLRQQVVETQEAAFAEGLDRAVRDDLEQIARLERTLAYDNRIVQLRAQVERQAQAQVDEGVITAAQYVEARENVAEAHYIRERHRVELAQARARFLTTYGIAPRPPVAAQEPDR